MVTAFDMLQTGPIVFSTQDQSKVTSAPKLVKSEGHIAWDKLAQQIYDMVRAFKPFPGSYAFLNNVRISVDWAVALTEQGNGADPGTIIGLSAAGIDVQCNASVLRIIAVKPEGKNIMAAGDFARGRKLTIGMRFS
jgi:methionyl-tRNA formyltransferase